MAAPIVESSIDWDSWTPGHEPAARLARQQDQLIAQAVGRDASWSDRAAQRGSLLASIEDNRLDKLSGAVSDAVARGASSDELARTLQGVLDDPAWAEMVATTEMARAMTAASLASYRDAGFPAASVLSSNDLRVCALCQENEDAGPIPVNDEPPNGWPPTHPKCRCAVTADYLTPADLTSMGYSLSDFGLDGEAGGELDAADDLEDDDIAEDDAGAESDDETADDETGLADEPTPRHASMPPDAVDSPRPAASPTPHRSTGRLQDAVNNARSEIGDPERIGTILQDGKPVYDADTQGLPDQASIAKVNVLRDVGKQIEQEARQRLAVQLAEQEALAQRIAALEADAERLGDQLEQAAAEATPDQAHVDDLRQRYERALDDLQAAEQRRDQISGRLADVRLQVLGDLRPMGGQIAFTESSAEAAQRRISRMLRHFPSDWVRRASDKAPLRAAMKQRGRAYFSAGAKGKTPKIVVAMMDSDVIAVHELAHMMEWAVPGIVGAQWVFWADRNSHLVDGVRTWTRLGRKRSMRALSPEPYDADEMSRPDEFKDPYIGRVYSDSPSDGWEVASMGSEMLIGSSDDPMMLAQDEDYLYFILGLWAVL